LFVISWLSALSLYGDLASRRSNSFPTRRSSDLQGHRADRFLGADELCTEVQTGTGGQTDHPDDECLRGVSLVEGFLSGEQDRRCSAQQAETEPDDDRDGEEDDVRRGPVVEVPQVLDRDRQQD